MKTNPKTSSLGGWENGGAIDRKGRQPANTSSSACEVVAGNQLQRFPDLRGRKRSHRPSSLCSCRLVSLQFTYLKLAWTVSQNAVRNGIIQSCPG